MKKSELFVVFFIILSVCILGSNSCLALSGTRKSTFDRQTLETALKSVLRKLLKVVSGRFYTPKIITIRRMYI